MSESLVHALNYFAQVLSFIGDGYNVMYSIPEYTIVFSLMVH